MNHSSESIESLLSSLTVEEKIKLLGGHPAHIEPREGDIYGVERVGLAPLKFADGPVGVHWWTKASTCYPALVCLAASFDEETAGRFGKAIGIDCRAAGVHVLLAPGVNLYRSPLCGRNFEYLGEDPELSGRLAAAYIRGVQEMRVAATVKHFAANNQEFERHAVSSDVDERTLREVYLRPFELAVKDGGTGCVMTAYNPVNGVHASENHWLLQTILREEWGFEGVVMSDWTSVYSTAQTLNAGLDLEMPWARYLNEEAVMPLLENGVVEMDVIDAGVRHRLELMDRFGWLHPRHEQKDSGLPARNAETEAVALDVARNGIVLLKNEDDLLPRPPKDVKRITVLGHHANSHILCGGGSAYCPPHESINLLEAIKATYGDNVDVEWYECVDPWREDQAREASAYRTPEGQPGLKAEYFANDELLGEAAVTRIDEKVAFNWVEKAPDPSLKGGFFSVRWTGKLIAEEEGEYDFYTMFSDGYLKLEIDGEVLVQKFPKSCPIKHHLTKGEHDVRIEFRQIRKGWVTCNIGFELASKAFVDYEAGLEAARNSDFVVVATGFVTQTEGEGHDRDFGLDKRLDRLVLDAGEANPNTAVVLYSGGACDVAPWIDKVKSVMCLWYPGQNGTIAAAEILAGQTNPSGKLPFTWEARLEDRGSYDCYHDEDGDNRVSYDDGVFTGYRHFDRHGIQPRFAFGHGLSYTRFAYENLRVSSERLTVDEPLIVQFDVINTGDIAGAESALVFVGDDSSSVPRPVRELKATRRVFLQPGERQTVTLALGPRAFAFWDNNSRDWAIEEGSFTIEVGSSAALLPLKQQVQQG